MRTTFVAVDGAKPETMRVSRGISAALTALVMIGASTGLAALAGTNNVFEDWPSGSASGESPPVDGGGPPNDNPSASDAYDEGGPSSWPSFSDSTSDTGWLKVLLTDAPLEGVEALVVRIGGVAVHEARGSGIPDTLPPWGSGIPDTRPWFVVSTQTWEGDLLQLRGGVTERLGLAALPAGRYTQVRVLIESARVLVNGNWADVRLPSDNGSCPPEIAPICGLKLVHPFEVQAGMLTELTLDFDVLQSLHFTPGRGCSRFPLNFRERICYTLRPIITVTSTITKALNHYKCYYSDGLEMSPDNGTTWGPWTEPGWTALVDRFGNSSANVTQVWSLCNPVSKNGSPVPDPTTHLACYVAVSPFSFAWRNVQVVNQFGNQTWTLTAPFTECNPAEKNGEQPVDWGFNHFRCYNATTPPPHGPINLTLADQFGNTTATIYENFSADIGYLCVPVSKNGSSTRDPNYNLACYYLQSETPAIPPQDVQVRDQFGLQRWRTGVINPGYLCVPSSISDLGSP